MCVGCSSFGITVMKGCIYVIGGHSGLSILKSSEIYKSADPAGS